MREKRREMVALLRKALNQRIADLDLKREMFFISMQKTNFIRKTCGNIPIYKQEGICPSDEQIPFFYFLIKQMAHVNVNVLGESYTMVGDTHHRASVLLTAEMRHVSEFQRIS